MREEYEQLELDTRSELDKAITDLTNDAIQTARDMILRCGEAPKPVHNRHEAYGIAAEQMNNISVSIKEIKNSIGILLGTLGDPNYSAVEATSSIVNSSAHAAAALIRAAAEMYRTLNDLYIADNIPRSDQPMMDDMETAGCFAEVEPSDTYNENGTEDNCNG